MASATEKRVTELLVENAQLKARIRAESESAQRELAGAIRRIQGDERDKKELEQKVRDDAREAGKWRALAEERETVIAELKDTRETLTDRLMGASAHIKGLEQENVQMQRQLRMLQGGRIVDIVPPDTQENINPESPYGSGIDEVEPIKKEGDTGTQERNSLNASIEMTEHEIVHELFEIWATTERVAHQGGVFGLTELTILQNRLLEFLRGIDDPKWKTEAARLLNKVHRAVAEQQSLPLDT